MDAGKYAATDLRRITLHSEAGAFGNFADPSVC